MISGFKKPVGFVLRAQIPPAFWADKPLGNFELGRFWFGALFLRIMAKGQV